MSVLLRPICWLRGHRSSMAILPEHGWGLYAYSWLGCSRCGLTTDRNRVEFAPCWRCPKGKCDRCDDCTPGAGLAR